MTDQQKVCKVLPTFITFSIKLSEFLKIFLPTSLPHIQHCRRGKGCLWPASCLRLSLSGHPRCAASLGKTAASAPLPSLWNQAAVHEALSLALKTDFNSNISLAITEGDYCALCIADGRPYIFYIIYHFCLPFIFQLSMAFILQLLFSPCGCGCTNF